MRATCGIRNRGLWAYVTIFGIQIIPWQRSWNAENFSSDKLDASFPDNCKKWMVPCIGNKYWHFKFSFMGQPHCEVPIPVCFRIRMFQTYKNHVEKYWLTAQHSVPTKTHLLVTLCTLLVYSAWFQGSKGKNLDIYFWHSNITFQSNKHIMRIL